MGNFFTPGKNSFYWTFVAYLADKNVYTKDYRLLPYTPNAQQLYIGFFPALFNPAGPVPVLFFINNNPVGTANVLTADGFVYLQIPLPKGKFTLKITDAYGNLLKTEFYITKNMATFFDVDGQNFEQRAVELALIQNDQDWHNIRSSRLYPVVGAYFDFPPPPGWTNDQYRAAILGGCGPGFLEAFWYGGTKKGIKDVIQSSTCAIPVIQPVAGGNTWVLYDAASAPDVTDPGSNAWVLNDTPPTPPHQAITLYDANYLTSAVDVLVSGSTRAVVQESVTKQTDSFIQATFPDPYVLDGQSLVLQVQFLDTMVTTTYTTVFPLGTTSAALAAAAIVAQNPALNAYDAGGGILRIGVAPVLSRIQEITVIGGGALAILGFNSGDSVEVSTDQLNNPWVQTPVAITFGLQTFIQGTDYTIDNNSGQIIWAPSGPSNLLPPKGSVFLASYSYQMRREIEQVTELVADATTERNYIYS